jgi:hypothetical protein
MTRDLGYSGTSQESSVRRLRELLGGGSAMPQETRIENFDEIESLLEHLAASAVYSEWECHPEHNGGYIMAPYHLSGS